VEETGSLDMVASSIDIQNRISIEKLSEYVTWNVMVASSIDVQNRISIEKLSEYVTWNVMVYIYIYMHVHPRKLRKNTFHITVESISYVEVERVY
jgi:hypothetical protein